MLTFWKFWNIPGQDQVYGPESSFDTKITNSFSAWYFNLVGLVEQKMPNALTLTTLDDIVTFVRLYTAGHIKAGGDDSSTYVPIGKKLMLIAKRGKPACRLEAFFISGKSFLECLSKPPSKLMRRTVKFCLIDALMIQPHYRYNMTFGLIPWILSTKGLL